MVHHPSFVLMVSTRSDLAPRAGLRSAVEDAGLRIRFTARTSEALAIVGREVPRLVLLDGGMEDADKLCHGIRTNRSLPNLPIIILESQVNDTTLPRAYRWGADDVVAANAPEQIATRLQALPKVLTSEPPPSRGEALVAEPDEVRRAAIARVLMNTGYRVQFAVDRASLSKTLRDPLHLVVASTAFGPPATLVREAREAGNNAIWIATCVPSEVEALWEAMPEGGKTAILSSFEPPENALFLANELTMQTRHQGRRTPRALYGTLVGFRAAGSDRDDFGYSYNVSPGGIYVRTLAPPPDDRIWIELKVPRESKTVRMEMMVAWARPFGPIGSATVPPGFGAAIMSYLGVSEQLWIDSIGSFVESRRRRSGLPPAPESDRPGASAEQAAPEPPASSPGVYRMMAPPSAPRPVTAGGARISQPEPPAASAPQEDKRKEEPPSPGLQAAPPPSGQKPVQDAVEEAADVLVPDDEPQTLPEEAGWDPLTPQPDANLAIGGQPAVAPPNEVAEVLELPAPPPSPPRDEQLLVPVAPEIPIAPAKVRSRVLPILVIGLFTIAGALGATIILERSSSRSTQPPTATAPTKKPKPKPRATASVSAPSAETSNVPPAGSHSASPAASAAPPDAEGLPPIAGMNEGGDGSELKWSQGYLVVRSPAEADVFAHAIHYGPTNKKLTVKCGLRWVRLARKGSDGPAGPKWMSEGKTVRVTCQSTTTVTILP